jgi:phage FluMu protein Com
MDRLDGNAIAGTLFDLFGEEMTTANGRCAHCSTMSRVAEAMVYLGGPGIVARCPRCDNVLMVIVDRRGTRCVDMTGLALLEQ